MTVDNRKIKLGITVVVCCVTGATVSLSKMLGSGMCVCELREERFVRLVLQVGEIRPHLFTKPGVYFCTRAAVY